MTEFKLKRKHGTKLKYFPGNDGDFGYFQIEGPIGIGIGPAIEAHHLMEFLPMIHNVMHSMISAHEQSMRDMDYAVKKHLDSLDDRGNEQ